MIKWGKRNRRQRWKCNHCNKVSTPKREDVLERNIVQKFRKSIIRYSSVSDAVTDSKITRRHFDRIISNIEVSDSAVRMYRNIPKNSVYVCDATWISKRYCVLIVYDAVLKYPIAWCYSMTECKDAWIRIFRKLPRPLAVVSDGQKGLKKASIEAFLIFRHQRCVIHVVRESLNRLNKNPKTEAAFGLRKIVADVLLVKSEEDVLVWKRKFEDWDLRYKKFVCERKYDSETGRRPLVHGRLHSVRTLILNALPDLFEYVSSPLIPRTTNFVEGGINSELKELIRRHRGLKDKKKIMLVDEFLQRKKSKK